MAETYIHCPGCGQKALAVATRCPRCGAGFESQLSHRPQLLTRPRRISLGPLVAVAAAGILWLVVAASERLLQPPGGSVPAAGQPAPSVTAPADRRAPPARAGDSVRADRPAPAAAAAPRRDSTSRTVAAVPTASPRPMASAAPVVAAGSSATRGSARRYARTWVNVRANRSGSAPVLRVLKPRELVLVGAEEQGWYRVVGDDHLSGFVDGRYLDDTPPAQSP